ncbi:MAG: hypothetical protein GXP63_03535 [DPANN group archaeon]|nr:hypothetical protein [DPANN group archaeon]
MGLEDTLVENKEEEHKGLEAKVGFRDILRQIPPKDYGFIGTFSLASALIAGPAMMLGTLASYLFVYTAIQKKKKEPLTAKGIKAESYFAAISASYFSTGYHYFNMLGSIFMKGLVGFFVGIPLSFAMYFPLKYLLHNYSPLSFIKNIGTAIKGAYQSFKANFKNAYTKTLKYLAVPLLAFWGLVPPDIQAMAHATGGRLASMGVKYKIDSEIKDTRDIQESPA